MKNSKFLLPTFIVLIFLFMFSSISVSAQIKNKTTINKTVFPKDKTIKTQPLELKNYIPHFKNITPVNLGNNNQLINRSNLKPVAQLPIRDFTIISSSVNGTMSARDPYLNNMAYLEFINGTVLPGEDKVNCSCNTPITYVKLILKATAGKDYMVTTVVSPRITSSSRLDFYTNGFIHKSSIINNNQEVKVILNALTTGQIELLIQCSDPNGVKTPWTFNSMSIQEVN